MGIRDRPTAPRSPWQNGHAERLIGSISGLCRSRSTPSGEDEPPGRQFGTDPGVRQADVVLTSMAVELAAGLDMQSPDSRSGTASTRD
jgi:hypothetical protein